MGVSSSMEKQLKPIDKRPALMLNIVKTIRRGMRSYHVQVIHQRYRGDSFTKDDCAKRYFEASNGFILASDGSPEVSESNPPNCSGLPFNRLFVRGSWDDSDNDIVTTQSISYVEELKVAVEEYNIYKE